MGIDFSGILRAARQVTGQTAELQALKTQLRTFESSLRSCWVGQEVDLYCEAIERLCAQIDSAINMCADASSSVNKAVLYAKELEATEKAAADLETT